MKEKTMKKSHLIIVVICSLSLLLLSGCYKDGDGQLELKEPKRELREMPPGIIWDASNPDNSRQAIREPDGSLSDPYAKGDQGNK
jgi:hypothetical protein